MNNIVTNIDHRTSSASGLTGNKVVNLDNRTLGDIKDLLLDLGRGQIAYVVLEPGSFLGLGGRYFAVPWNALRVESDNKPFVLDANKEQFENAEGLDKNNWPDFANPTFGDKAHRAFDREPYYTNR